MVANAIEIEIDGKHNENLHFRPLQKSIRGRLDLMRIGEPMAKMKTSEWPDPIPGQRIGIDPDGTGYVREVLHEETFAPIKERIERKGQKLEPPVTEFENIDVPTWLFWIKRAVQDGIAKVTKGTLPDTIKGKIRKNFIVSRPEQNQTDKLTEAINRQTVMFEKLLSKLSD